MSAGPSGGVHFLLVRFLWASKENERYISSFLDNMFEIADNHRVMMRKETSVLSARDIKRSTIEGYDKHPFCAQSSRPEL